MKNLVYNGFPINEEDLNDEDLPTIVTDEWIYSKGKYKKPQPYYEDNEDERFY
jgi:hypothetical protein